MTDPDQFWRRVDTTGGPDACWPWLPPRTHRGGYGQLGWESEARAAHSVAYQLATGGRARGHVCHRCHNPACCNPRHLYDGSALTNMQDRAEAGRYASGDDHWSRRAPERVVANERHGMARLTDEDVARLRAERAAGADRATLASRYGVSRTHVSRIVSGRSRKVAAP